MSIIGNSREVSDLARRVATDTREGRVETRRRREVPRQQRSQPPQRVPESRPRRERGSIDETEILDAAFQVAEQVSIDNLNMPLVAKHLNVPVTSIYWHFRKKDDLLDAMADRALGEFNFATPFTEDKSWRDSLRNHARKMRRAFLDNPVLCDLILIRGSFGQEPLHAALVELEQSVESLLKAGFTPQDAVDTFAAVALHTRGSAILERVREKTRSTESGRKVAQQPGNFLDAETLPVLAELATRGPLTAFGHEANFEYVLDCILDHAGQRLAETARRRAVHPNRIAAKAKRTSPAQSRSSERASNRRKGTKSLD
jgi:AcrR family transcriptional regulator